MMFTVAVPVRTTLVAVTVAPQATAVVGAGCAVSTALEGYGGVIVCVDGLLTLSIRCMLLFIVPLPVTAKLSCRTHEVRISKSVSAPANTFVVGETSGTLIKRAPYAYKMFDWHLY